MYYVRYEAQKYDDIVYLSRTKKIMLVKHTLRYGRTTIVHHFRNNVHSHLKCVTNDLETHTRPQVLT